MQPIYRDPDFANSPLGPLVSEQIPNAIKASVSAATHLIVDGSIGKGTWAHAPWVALLDRAVTTSVQEGPYVVYLLSLGCERLYLTLAQGCTELNKAIGTPKAKAELRRRVAVMQSRLEGIGKRLKPLSASLGSDTWRCELYEAGVVVGVEYQANSLPAENDLRADLEEALSLYRQLWVAGGADPEDAIIAAAEEDLGSKDLRQAKRYRLHRSIERQAGHSKEVKKRQGTICKGCDKDMANVYGEVARGLIDAHHLTPLSNLKEGEIARFDPIEDFAVLCPNCHRVIHRMDDASDIAALRQLVAAR